MRTPLTLSIGSSPMQHEKLRSNTLLNLFLAVVETQSPQRPDKIGVDALYALIHQTKEKGVICTPVLLVQTI